MINIHTEALEKLNANEMWLMLHIVKRINIDRSAFPSKKTILKDTGWKSEKTLSTVMQSLVEKGMITIQVRRREDGSQTSNLYRVTSNLFGVYVSADKLQEHTVKNTTPRGQKIQGGGVHDLQGGEGQKIQGGSSKNYYPNEVLYNEVLNNEVLYNELNDSAFSSEKGSMQEVAHEFEKNGEPEPVKAQKKKSPPKLREIPPTAKEPRQPTETYLYFEAWAKFAENKGIPVSKKGNSYTFALKDGSAIKLWRSWASGLPGATGTLQDWEVFLEAAWEHGGKWIRANFSPCILNSKRTELMSTIRQKQAATEVDTSLVGLSNDDLLKYF